MIPRLTRSQWISGIAITAAVSVAGMISFDSVNRRFTERSTREISPGTEAQDAPAPGSSAAPCVAADGSWKNWPYPNVPMLAPKCDDDGKPATPN